MRDHPNLDFFDPCSTCSVGSTTPVLLETSGGVASKVSAGSLACSMPMVSLNGSAHGNAADPSCFIREDIHQPHCLYAGLSIFLFFRRPKGFLYWIAKQIVFILAYIFGRLQRVDFHEGAPLVKLATRLPVVVFSHGLGGQRCVYSIICSELASQGYVVLALEHADGTSSCAKLAGGQGYKFYEGLGGNEGQVEKTRNRVKEMQTAAKVLEALQQGTPLDGLFKLSSKLNPATFFAGALDLRCLAAVGHSYGGATVAALVSEDSAFRCGVCLDPWWAALPPEALCLHKWETRAPLLVMGSHDWNVPNLNGEVLCGPHRQERIFEAAKVRKSEGELRGAGALMLVIAGSSHNTFSDPLPLFSEHVGWVLRALGLTARLDPVLGVHLVNASVLNFLSLHLPLTGDQRQLQTWAPSSGHNALDRIAELTKADAATSEKGLLSSLFPGRGVLNAASDAVLDIMLSTPKKPEAKISPSKENIDTSKNGRDSPDDVVTGKEVLEAAMPSSDPASGAHPHAPSLTRQASAENGASIPPAIGGATGESRFDARQRQALRSCCGSTYADEVREEHVNQFLALLGEEHVWKCEVHA